MAKVNPPLRSSRDVEALRASVNDGVPIAIVSDHAPHLIEDKRNENYDDIPSGFPGLETAFGVLNRLVRRGELDMAQVVRELTSKPARRFGLNGKGSIAFRMDADLTIVDPDIKWKVNPSQFYSKSKFSPFNGYELQGKVVATMIRGNWAFKDGKPAETASGEVLKKRWT